MPVFPATSAGHWAKILCLAGLFLILAGSAPAQEQSAPGRTPPPAAASKPGVKLKAAPRRAPVAMPQKAEEKSLRESPEESLDLKKSTGKIGGQEVPHKKPEQDQ